MLAFDRDGTVIGSPTNFRANHPELIKQWPIQKKTLKEVGSGLYRPVTDKIKEPCILISNQGGIGHYISCQSVGFQMRALMLLVPQLQRCYWVGSNETLCYWVDRDPQNRPIWEQEGVTLHSIQGQASYRKPSGEMLRLAQAHGFNITAYVGDLGGREDYADGRDSDRRAAINAGIEFIDAATF